nr:twin-arginine translocase subunit TatB [Chloroflexota bacterium]
MNLFNIGPMELLFILILALLIFGPRRLPQIARDIGRAIAEFRKASEELTTELRKEIESTEAALEEAQKEVAESAKAALEGTTPTKETPAPPQQGREAAETTVPSLEESAAETSLPEESPASSEQGEDKSPDELLG